MKERYEGKSGSTQGDRKENSPPPNATRIDSSPAIGSRHRPVGQL